MYLTKKQIEGMLIVVMMTFLLFNTEPLLRDLVLVLLICLVLFILVNFTDKNQVKRKRICIIKNYLGSD